jgi:hypothetical protein
MPSVQDEIRSRVDAFVSELTALVRQAALETLSAALGEEREALAVAPSPAPRATAPRSRTSGRRPGASDVRARAATPSRSRAAKPKAKPAPEPAPAPAAPEAKAAAKAPAPPAGKERKKGQKRDSAELARLGERLLEYIKANPRQRMEVIQVALGVPAADLKFPIKQLRAANRITSTGAKQATTYTAR